jgi:hypothetical protein
MIRRWIKPSLATGARALRGEVSCASETRWQTPRYRAAGEAARATRRDEGAAAGTGGHLDDPQAARAAGSCARTLLSR